MSYGVFPAATAINYRTIDLDFTDEDILVSAGNLALIGSSASYRILPYVEIVAAVMIGARKIRIYTKPQAPGVAYRVEVLANIVSTGVVLPAPVVTSAKPYADTSYTGNGLSDPAGGTDIWVYGTGFVAGASLEWRQAGVTIGTASGGGCVVVGPTSLYATVPALAAGIYDLRVVNPDTQNSGASGNGLHESWAPTADATTGCYLPGGYSVAGAQGVNAVGTWTDQSGNARHFTSQGGINAPAAHASAYPLFDNGVTCDGLLRANTSFGDLAAGAFFTSAGDGAMVVIAEHASPLGAYVANYQNAGMVCGIGASPSFVLSKAGIVLTGYDLSGQYTESNRVGIDPARPYVFAGRWNAIGFQTSANGEDWNTVAPYGGVETSMDPSGNIGIDSKIGQGYGAGYHWNGPIKAVAFYASGSTLTTALLAKWNSWSIIKGYTAAVVAIDPAALAFEILNKIPFVSLPWAGTASTGNSGTNSITTQGGDPTVGAALNGMNTADFIAADPDYSGDAGVANNVSLAASAGFFFAFVNCDIIPAAAGVDYQDGNLYTDPTNAETTMGITTAGYSSAFYDGAYKRLNNPYPGTGVWKMVMTRIDGTYVTARVGRGPWKRLAVGPLPFLVTSPFTVVGRSYAGVNHFDGRLAARGVAPIAFTYAQIDGMIKWVEETYGVPQ